MPVAEIDQKAWCQFCLRVQDACRGSMISMEIMGADGSRRMVARDMPLRSVALDYESSPCNQAIVIEAGIAGEKPVRHLIVEPIHIRLSKNGGGERYSRMQIMAENGTTVLDFHPGLTEGLLKGLEGIS